MTPDNLNLYVVDDDEAVRQSLSMLLISRGFRVQAMASGETFLAKADLLSPGCVVLDLRMDGMSGLQVFDVLRERASPLVVLFLSGHGDIPLATEAMRKGASIWLPKPCSDELLLSEVRLALERSAAQQRQRQEQQQAQAIWGLLTAREKEVARLVARDLANKEIARELGCEPRTVETHRAHIRDKLGSSHITEWARVIQLAEGMTP